jgi:glycosyltransferase involved in cell wall biosynthesis
MSNADHPRRTFFVHMQKTAGTALRQGLINHFGKRAVYPTQGVDGTDPTQLVTSTDYLRERVAARGEEIEAITGHFPLCTRDLLDGGYTTVTLLREPVERTLSYLRHHRKEEPADRDKSLEEIYENPFRFSGFVHNHMTKMLSLTPAEMTDGMLTPLELNEIHLERAKGALEGIDAVGLQERFDEFFGWLGARFGWQLGEPETLNATDPVDVPQSFRDRITEDNALDVELYECAKELVASRSERKSFIAGGPEMTELETEAPVISVIIPTYNRASLLERSLESLTEQTLPRDDFEVVVVDDGSSDWTRTVCTKLADQLPLRYFRIENSGISAAKNLGVFASRAPLLLFFDDDDVADPGLLEAHLETHREHPDEQVTVLGYTTWADELEVTPIMEYVTEIGQHLFSYKNLEDGQRLDYTYFWGGRSSCKRALLTTHGSFDQDMSGIEDMELGFRLARQGLSVVHTRDAKSYMVRPVTFDQFAERCLKRGRALWRFTQRHEDPEVDRYCRVEEALEDWPSLEPQLEAKAERVRELERRYSETGELAEEEWVELHELYRWTLEAFQSRGVAEAAADASDGTPRHPLSYSLGSSPASAICEEPIFIIGSPRSGTSILAWSLAEHSELWTEAESDIFYYLLRDGSLENAYETATARTDGSWLRNQGVDLEQFLVHVGLGLNVLLTGTSNGRRWVDQTPANTLVVERLGEMFPGARFLHILRDGRRVVHSMINFHRAMGDPEAVERMRDAGRLPPWTTDFGDACRTWTRFVRIATDFGRWHPDRTHTLTNEGLITDPEHTMHGVLEFLGLPQEPGPARFLRENRINSSFAASGRSTQAPPALSEPWREWQPEQREAFLENAGETMIVCGLATEAELRAGVDSVKSGSRNGAGAGQARTGTGSRNS